VTYAVSVILTGQLGPVGYLKWILGSETWYYYLSVYTCFLFVFKWFYAREGILWFWIAVQTLSLVLASIGISTTIPLPFFTDYLNPLHWVGYFSFGILVRKHRWDLILRKKKGIAAAAAFSALFFLYILCSERIFTYFHIATFVFCVSSLIASVAVAYAAAALPGADRIGKIGTYAFCIYLLHVQILQGITARLPDGIIKILFAPFIGLGIMLILISAGLALCKKLPFGEKLKALVGL
jgi:peptidoglycan/LPS O-acetylase OafA/YrhL